MSLPEALWIVSQNKNGVAMNYWDTYLPAILIVNEAFPITGYNLVDSEEDDFRQQDYLDTLAGQRETEIDRLLGRE